MNTKTKRGWFVFLSMMFSILLMVGVIYADNPASGLTDTGQQLEIEIQDPLANDVLLCQDFTVSGQTAIGGLAADSAIMYVVDVSSSTNGPANQDCDGNGVIDEGDDINGDSRIGNTLDCEISGVLALNESIETLSNVAGGLVVFGSGAAVADVGPSAGQQNFSSPLNSDDNANSISDMEEVARSITQGSVGLFTGFGVGSSTDFNDALESVNLGFTSISTGTQRVVYFLTDGGASVNTSASAPLADVAAAGIVVNTFAIGSGAQSCEPNEAIQIIADTTGGVCTEVADPTDLSAELTGSTPAGIERVFVQLNSGAQISATLDALGNWSADLMGDQLVDGTNILSATVVATDMSATEVTADISFVGNCTPGGIVLSPPTANQCVINDNMHTVTATVSDDLGDPLMGVDVMFEITGGPNMGMTGTATTDAAGSATYTYVAASMDGVDTIVASFIDGDSNTVISNEVMVNWQCSPTDVNLAVFDGSGPAQNSLLVVVGLMVAALAGGILMRRRSEI